MNKKIILLILLIPFLSGCLIGPFVLRKQSVNLISRNSSSDNPPWKVDSGAWQNTGEDHIYLGITKSQVIEKNRKTIKNNKNKKEKSGTFCLLHRNTPFFSCWHYLGRTRTIYINL